MSILMYQANQNISCPLCDSSAHSTLDFSFKSRIFFHCAVCDLIFAHPDSFPDLDTEKNRYLHHKNDQNNDGYVSFLSQIIKPLTSLIQKDANGLDFGCGPNPVLSAIMTQKGFPCDYFDPIFFPKNLNRTYDYIVATECFEHFFKPKVAIKQVTSILKTNGILAVMTNTWDDNVSFKSWYYMRDWTHVSFYHQKTIQWICKSYGYSIVYNFGKNIFILKKD
jgi:hypothetical protein